MNSKKNIAVVTQLFPNSQFPILGTFVAEGVLELQKNYNITIIAPLPWFPKLKIFKTIFPKWYKSSLVNDVEQFNGIPVHHPRYFSLPKKLLFSLKGYLYFLSIRVSVKKIIKKNNISLIHSYFLYPDNFAISIIAQQLKLPIITTVCGSDINANINSKKITSLITKSLDRTQKIITISNDLYKKIIALGIPNEKISTIPIGYRTDRFKQNSKKEIRERLKLPQNKKIVLFVGNLVAVKGIEYLIDAFAQIHDKINDTFLIIIGKGDQKKYIEQLESLDLSDSAVLTGAIPHQELNQWMSSADVFVLPSIQEGLGAVLIESMACGIPAVGSRVGGIPDIINIENGFLCTPKSVNDLSEKIIFALEKKWDKQKITESVHKFRWDIIALKISALYDDLTK